MLKLHSKLERYVGGNPPISFFLNFLRLKCGVKNFKKKFQKIEQFFMHFRSKVIWGLPRKGRIKNKLRAVWFISICLKFVIIFFRKVIVKQFFICVSSDIETWQPKYVCALYFFNIIKLKNPYLLKQVLLIQFYISYFARTKKCTHLWRIILI